MLLAMSGSEEEWRALKPREPSPSQCCGGGCQPCVYDVYEQQLARWERARAARDKGLLVEGRGEVSAASRHPQAALPGRALSCGRVAEGGRPRGAGGQRGADGCARPRGAPGASSAGAALRFASREK